MNISDLDYSLRKKILSDKSVTNEFLTELSDNFCRSAGDKKLFSTIVEQHINSSKFSATYEKEDRLNFSENLNSNKYDLLLNPIDENKCFDIIFYLPPYNPRSAGIKVLYELAYKLNLVVSLNIGIQLFSQNSTNLTSRILLKTHSKSIIIVPETLKTIQHQSKYVILYLLNKINLLPTVEFGPFSYDPFLQIAHSKSICDSVPRLFRNTVNFEKFKPSQIEKKGGVGIYLGKHYLDSKHKEHLQFISNLHQTTLIIKRDWPSMENLILLLRNLDYLVSLDPVSSLNIESTILGTPVLFSDLGFSSFTKSDLKKYELINDLMILEEDTPKRLPLENLGSSVSDTNLQRYLELELRSKSIEEKDFSWFIDLISDHF